jgi:hypothetical protein
MSARIVELSQVVARRHEQSFRGEPSPSELPLAARFRFWRGASGERYLHTVYGLIDCPPLPRANYMLVHRDASGASKVLRIGHTSHEAGTLNLAEIRHRGAKLGANEVHVHFLAESERERRVVELDLCTRVFGTLASEPAPASTH